MNKYKFFVFCPEDGFEVFETLDDALDDANEKIKGYLDDGWSEDVTGVCAGKITHRATMCDQVFRDGEVDEDGIDEAGDYWDPDFGYKCNYKMMLSESDSAASNLADTAEMAKKQECDMKNKEWGGEGTPPIGTVCEYYYSEGDEWRKCEVVAYYLSNVVAVDVFDSAAVCLPSDLFRPVKTPEQIAEEERLSAIDEMIELVAGDSSFNEVMGVLYDAWKKL